MKPETTLITTTAETPEEALLEFIDRARAEMGVAKARTPITIQIRIDINSSISNDPDQAYSCEGRAWWWKGGKTQSGQWEIRLEDRTSSDKKE